MTNHKIDNSIKDLGKTVLWQYDKAYRLLSILKHMQVLYHCAVEQFWNYWVKKVLAIDTCDKLGCSIWGRFLGVPRPTIRDNNGKVRLIATSVYRRVLKGSFFLMKSSGSFQDILGYLEIVFGIPGEDSFSPWTATCSEYGWTTNVDELNDGTMTGDTLLLKLYDPEGVCRKIGGAPRNSLTITVSYDVGDTTIVATAVRRRKCGVLLTDNGNMSITYSKSEYYDSMHRDQQYLFEQRQDEFCPYPLGVKTNDFSEEYVFGFGYYDEGEANGWLPWTPPEVDTYFYSWEIYTYNRSAWKLVSGRTIPAGTTMQQMIDNGWVYLYKSNLLHEEGQQCDMYEPGIAYPGGAVFGYIDDEGYGFKYECKSRITAAENISFESIKDKLMKTNKGDPIVGNLIDGAPNVIGSGLDIHVVAVEEFLLESLGINYENFEVTDMGYVRTNILVKPPTIYSKYRIVPIGFCTPRVENKVCFLRAKVNGMVVALSIPLVPGEYYGDGYIFTVTSSRISSYMTINLLTPKIVEVWQEMGSPYDPLTPIVAILPPPELYYQKTIMEELGRIVSNEELKAAGMTIITETELASAKTGVMSDFYGKLWNPYFKENGKLVYVENGETKPLAKTTFISQARYDYLRKE